MSIDIETYSETDLGKCGVYAYASDPSFEILLCSYSFDGREVITLTSERTLREDKVFVDALYNREIEKRAWNANFERVCLGRILGKTLRPEDWSCSMVLSQYLGLPASLEAAGAILHVEEQKMREGKNLIQYFSKPCKATKTNGGRTRNRPEDAPEKWELFCRYNAQDVRTEMSIREKLDTFSLPVKEQRIYALDQRINDRGICLDMDLVSAAIDFDEQFSSEKIEEAQKLTGLENPKSVSQLKAWIEETEGVKVETLNKKAMSQLRKTFKNPQVLQMLDIRDQLSKASVAKYSAMERACCPDGRARGLLQYYGASRTGRWAGRLIQVQNLPQNHLQELSDVREIVRDREYESIELIYQNPAAVLSRLIRTAFVPSAGCRFVVADYSAIEARVIAWLADESWRQKVFAEGGDIYCASATQMFKVPVVKHGTNGHLRQKGKIAELALGYGGSVGALKQMGALEMGIPEEELQSLVDQWRSSNPAIIRLWSILEEAALVAVRNRIKVNAPHGISMEFKKGFLFTELPSGRKLYYAKPKIGRNRFGRPSVIYKDTNQTTRKLEDTETYGGKITENIVQAIARDCLAEAMLALSNAGFQIVMHVHDEVVLDVPESQTDALRTATEIMGQPIPWAPGLLLRADGYECHFYRKD